MFSLTNSLKTLRRLGLRPLALYALYKFGLITGYYKCVTPAVDTGSSKIELPGIARLFALPDRDQLKRILGNEGQRALLGEADEIVSGRIRVFNESVPIDFNHDQPLQHWTAYETNPDLLSSFHFQHDDIKYLWEPARFGWAFTLGRAYHLTQDNKYAEAFWKYFESFNEMNPPNLGPHWMNGQEVAIRLMAIVWTREVFEAAPASSAERRGQLLQSIYAHASRIPRTLVYASSQNNNHLLTEAAAVYTAGLVFKNKKWRALGWKWLNWSFQNQIGSYGEYIQHSTNYHRLMLQAALFVDAIKDDNWPYATHQALARASHWLFSLLDLASGQVPNLGANDGALILPLGSASAPFNDYRPTLQAAARAFLETQIESGNWDEMSLWLDIEPVKGTYQPENYLSDNLRGKESWGYLRASTFKSRLSHMDQLHLDLWWRGLNIAQDAGTYLYNGEVPWDNPLVTTRVHNTVTVDGRDQMTRAGRFLTLDWVNAYSRSEIAMEEDVLQRVKAYHKGYRGIKHERTVTVFADERWVVEDKLIRDRLKPHTYRLHWLLPDWEYEIRESIFEIRLKSSYGWVTLRAKTNLEASNSEYRVSLVRAGKLVYGERGVKPFEGWVSPTYGTKLPALSLAFEVTSSHNVTITSEFIFPE